MSVLLDGVWIKSIGWAGRRSLMVEFGTIYENRLHQLYAGRCLVGHTRRISERRIIFQFNPTTGTPATLMLAAVSDGEGSVEYGDRFGRLPANRYVLRWSASSYPADADHFEITGSTEPGGEVDPENVLKRLQFVGDGVYEWETPYLDGSGQHKFRITPAMTANQLVMRERRPKSRSIVCYLRMMSPLMMMAAGSDWLKNPEL